MASRGDWLRVWMRATSESCSRVMVACSGSRMRTRCTPRPRTWPTTCCNRTYTVTLTNYSPSCAGEHVFAATWPEAYTHHPVQIVANDAPEDAPVIADGTMKDVSRVLTSIGVVLWPELYHL